MAQTDANTATSRRRRSAARRQGLWASISEKVVVAAVTAVATGLITLAGPPIRDRLFSAINETDGVTRAEAEFQQQKWAINETCANSQPIWHETARGQKIDATICPGTGDILLVLKDSSGRQIQWWSDNRSLTRRFSTNSDLAELLSDAIVAPAYAASPVREDFRGPRLAQNVLCQMMLPDNRGLRRRLVVGPNQCVELIIDTWTGAVVSQRRIPCVQNCAVNV